MAGKHTQAMDGSIAILDTPAELTALEKCLLNEYQRGFPLCSSPFQALAEQQGEEHSGKPR